MANPGLLLPGDKIKVLRKKYKLSQEDLAGSNISKSLINEIESNKASITFRTAEIIITNLNKIAKQKNFVVNETVDYLIDDEFSQVIKIIDDYINELKTLITSKNPSFIKTLKEVEEFLISWDIKEKKIIVYELAGDYFYNQNDINKSVIYYEKALTLIGKLFPSNQLLVLLRKLSMLYGYIGKYDEDIEICDFALNHFLDMTDDYNTIFTYNSAVCYRLLKNYDKALENLERAENTVDKSDLIKLFKILIEKAICLKYKGCFHKSINTYNKILTFLDDKNIDKKISTYINIVNLYMTLNDRPKIDKYFKIILSKLNCININNQYTSSIYFELGKIYEYLDNNSDAEIYYLKSLNLCKEHKNYVLANEVLSALIKLYELLNNVEKMDKLKNEIFLISSKQERIDNMLMYKLINFYSSINDIVKVKEISIFALNNFT
ncbi:helix-turn-helix domain-containing protein [Clostridium neuense]|uniref:Helix-turn-helix domain-containing protein n=1 Tax=Clostridium neuense TaxID=1728934 RepID=A0ABW8TFF9_9CLOT